MTDSTNNDEASSMKWGSTSFTPGSHVGLVARRTLGLVARDNPSTREQLWALVSNDASIDDILEELSSTGLKSLPDFALAQVEGDNVRVVARGSASVSAESSSGDSQTIDASDVRTWIEDVVSDVVSVTVGLADDADASSEGGGFAVLAGSVPASSMTRRFDEADMHAAGAESWSSGVASASSAAPVDDTDQAEPELAAAPDVELELAADDAAEPELAAAESAEIAPDEPEAPVAPPAGDASAWFEDDSGGAPDAADAAPSEPQPPEPPAAPVAEPQPAHPQPPAPVVTGPEAMGPGPSGPPPVGAVPGDGPAVASTDEAFAPIDQPAPPAPFDAQADLEQSLGDVEEASAVVGVLAFSNGERLNVDRSILIGRNPKVTGAVDGPLPYIMKYEGPGQGLSRTHAEVRVEAGEIVLEDLRSTNGTDVQLPGQQRRRLQGGEPVVVVPGTLIDFGEELHCTVEAVQ